MSCEGPRHTIGAFNHLRDVLGALYGASLGSRNLHRVRAGVVRLGTMVAIFIPARH